MNESIPNNYFDYLLIQPVFFFFLLGAIIASLSTLASVGACAVLVCSRHVNVAVTVTAGREN